MKKSTCQKALAAITAAMLTTVSLAGCGKSAPAESPAPAPEPSKDAVETPAEASTADQAEDTSASDTAASGAESEATTDDATSASSDNMLSNGDFSEGLDPWLTFCQDGECMLSVDKDEALDVDIKRLGTVEHGVQVYHDGFSLEEGCVYKLTFDARCDIEREVELRFQLNGGDYHAYYMEYVPLGTETTPYEYTFTMNETTDPAPRFCFNMGVVEDIDPGQSEHHIYFDNFVLTLTDDSGRVEGSGQVQMPDIAVNQIGYLPGAYKSATLRGAALRNTALLINEKTKEIVLEKEIEGGVSDPDTGDEEALFDFSSIKDEGTYHVEAGEAVSPSFRISEDVYKDAFDASLKMLYYQRCGMKLTSDFAGDFAHPVCHAEKAVLYEDNSVSLDVSGGWHDAGDYGRYSVAGAKTAADLLLAYENYPEVFGDDIGIPESGNGIPDVLDEARYELEWLLKMQADNGGVYHKVTCQNFPSEIMPEEETDQLIIMPATTTATGDFVGVMAIAARVYKSIDKAFSDTCLATAKKAADYLYSTPTDTVGYKNPSDIATGEYEDTCDIDERFWAFSELLKTTGDRKYESDIAKVLPNNGYTLGWQGVAGYGGYAFLTSAHPDATLRKSIHEVAENMGYYITDCAAAYPYGSSIIGDYPWGSNLTIANNGAYLLMMKNLIASYDKTAVDKQLSYLFGNNATGYCFFTGFGSTYADHPHHRPSQAKDKTVPGMLVGGPNNGLDDPYVQNVLKGVPSAKCYADSSQSYSTNEVAIYWNSPLIYLLAGELAESR